MIDTYTYNHQLPTVNVEQKSERTVATLSGLLFDFNSFRKEVFIFRSNYQGPDYFDILQNVSELQTLMDFIISHLKIHVGDMNRIPYRTLTNSLEFSLENTKVQVNSDTEGIALMLLRLTNLIQTNHRAAKEAEGLEEFFIESLLLDFEKELEKYRWVFYLFSKY